MVIHAPFDLSLNEQFNLLPVGLYQIVFNDDSDLSFHMRNSELTYTNSFYAGQTVNLQGRLIDYIILETGSGYILPGMQILAPYQASIQQMNISSLPGLTIDTWNAGNLSIGSWSAGSIDIGTINSLTAGNITIVGNSNDLLTPVYQSLFSLDSGASKSFTIVPASGKEIYLEAIIIMVEYQAGTTTTGYINVEIVDTSSVMNYSYSIYQTSNLDLTYPGSQELVLGILPTPNLAFTPGNNFYWAGRVTNDQQTYVQIVPFHIQGTNEVRISIINNGSGNMTSVNAYVLLRGKVIPL